MPANSSLQTPETPQAVLEALKSGVSPQQLDLSGLNAVIECSPADAVVTVQTGITLCDLDDVLTPHGLMWPLGYPDPENIHLSDILAEDRLPLDLASGWLGDLKCFPRDWILGGQTASVSNGLTRWGGKVVKNVTGYDMRQLYVGGRSEFGVITEATLRLVSRPEVRHGFECQFDDWASAAARSLILAESCRPWLTRLLLVPDPAHHGRIILQGVFSGRAEAVASLLKAQDLQESPKAISSLNAHVAPLWGPDAIAPHEHAFPLGNLEAMGEVIASLPPETPWLAWPEPGWLVY